MCARIVNQREQTIKVKLKIIKFIIESIINNCCAIYNVILRTDRLIRFKLIACPLAAQN